MKTYILYHAQCPDGFGAAYAAWKALGTLAEYIPVAHHQPPPVLEDHAIVYMVDFCYGKGILLDIVSKMEKVIVLDHHQSAEKEVKDIPLEHYPSLSITFDMQKSGAVLSWEYFHDTPVPSLLRYIEDKDLWRFHLPDSKEVTAAIRSYPMDFELWDSFEVDTLIKEGKVLLRYQTKVVEKLCGNAHIIQLGGYKVPAVNSSILQSEIGNNLCKLYPSHPFGVVYFNIGEKHYFSLRSVGEFDVAAIAASQGGGGHRNAAGFMQKDS